MCGGFHIDGGDEKEVSILIRLKNSIRSNYKRTDGLYKRILAGVKILAGFKIVCRSCGNDLESVQSKICDFPELKERRFRFLGSRFSNDLDNLKDLFLRAF